MSTMIKIRIRNDDHEIDLQFPISENKLYAKLAEIHAIEGKNAPQSAFVTEVYPPPDRPAVRQAQHHHSGQPRGKDRHRRVPRHSGKGQAGTEWSGTADRQNAAEVSQIIIRYDGMYRRCIRAKLTDLCYEGIKGEWRPVGSVLFGNASVIEFNSDTGSFENLLYVQEDVSDTKEQLETKLDNPDEIILDRICDEVFGDGWVIDFCARNT